MRCGQDREREAEGGIATCRIVLRLLIFLGMICPQVIPAIRIRHEGKQPLLISAQARGYVSNDGLRLLAEIFGRVVEQAQVIGQFGICSLDFGMGAPSLDDVLN